MKRGEYSFWRHRDRIPEIPEPSAELCDCCYCIYSPKPHQTRTLGPQISPERISSGLKNRLRFNSVVKQLPTPFSVTSYAGQSIGGTSKDSQSKPKMNQDSLVMLEDPRTRSLMLACLDGHGTHGHIISQFFKFGLETRLFGHDLWEHDPKGAVTQLLLDLEQEICQYPQVETQFSGTTLVLAVVRGSQLIVANIGDSRALLGSSPPPSQKDSGGNRAQVLVPVSLSTDHRPEAPKELSRILRAGGRVFSIPQEGPLGAQRVWLAEEDVPGLAMSRSLGDEVARSVGVIATPEFVERQLHSERDCLLVLGTDGLWDYLTNEEVLEMISAHEEDEGGGRDTPGQHVLSLIQEASRRWMVAEGRQDDITACVATLAGRKRQKRC